ncbi:glycosyltransferase [Neorhizobium lilium]|uniref:Glycosyltransferase n=1 Tax=Neorhizobium lilium TaxID=2503024 RepID=A0A444LK83_9HYPH|nr:glycosyltransferase [Neorhizobium lilium]RWX79409.1 glycosyltransferase [Neorhizobium lilium]
MRILRIISDVDPRAGGPVEGLRLSSMALAEMGHETEVVCLDDPQAAYVSSFPFPVHACGPVARKYGYTPALSRWILANGHRFDAAAVHGLWNHASIGGWQGLRRAKLPYVVFTHGMMDPWFKQTAPLKHWAKQAFWLAWQGKVLRDAQAVLFTSEEERRQARGIFWGYDYAERVVAYGSSGPSADAQGEIAAFHARLPEVSGKRFLLFLSRIHSKKGCDLLLEAFASVAGKYPDVDLVIAGPDQVGLKALLMERAEKAGLTARIHWPGMLSGPAKWGAFRAAEAFVLPSHQENFGIVVAEAMACGTPVLITDKVNIWRQVEASGGGLVRPDTLTGITDLLMAWFDLAGERRDEMRYAARLGFERHFRADVAARDLADALQLAAGKKAA